jgi:hypothetical protein
LKLGDNTASLNEEVGVMDSLDFVIFGILAGVLAFILATSRTARIIVRQAFMHPLQSGYIVTHEDGSVEYSNEQPSTQGNDEEEDESNATTKAQTAAQGRATQP